MNDKQTPEDDAKAEVQSIIDAATEAATEIIEEAEAKAKRYVEESRKTTEKLAFEQATDMRALTDDLIARAETVRRQSDELLAALNQSRRGAESTLKAAPAPSTSRKAAAGAPLKAVDSPKKGKGAETAPEAPSEGARLLATQMAVAGSSRTEIATRLREDFGIADPEPMVDAILGAG